MHEANGEEFPVQGVKLTVPLRLTTYRPVVSSTVVSSQLPGPSPGPHSRTLEGMSDVDGSAESSPRRLMVCGRPKAPVDVSGIADGEATTVGVYVDVRFLPRLSVTW